MGSRLAEIRRTLTVLWIAVRGLFSFLPFAGNLLIFLLFGGRFRRRLRGLLTDPDEVEAETAGPTAVRGRAYFLAGEDSGDLHAANLIASLRAAAPAVECRGMGGPRMAEAGCALDYDLARMNVMGVLPVIRSVGTFFGLFRRLLRMLETDPPDVLVPVDYPGFNLRVARLARRRGVKVVYYIAPQVWAWAPWRIRRIARSVDRLLVILPFEKEIFEAGGIDCRFVGHPLFEHLEREAPAAPGGRDGPPRSIGLLPGSREAEIRSLLPPMLRAARRIASERPDARFVIPYRREDLRARIEELVAGEGEGLEVRIEAGRTHEVMRELDLALVASGTATLELAYYRVPMVVLYRVGRLARFLMRFAILVPHVALVNIVAGREVVPEFVGPEDHGGAAAERLLAWMADGGERERVRAELDAVRDRLGFAGVSRSAAGCVARLLPAE